MNLLEHLKNPIKHNCNHVTCSNCNFFILINGTNDCRFIEKFGAREYQFKKVK